MAELYRSDVIPATATRVWSVVRDFNALPLWTPFVASSRIEGGMPADRVGCVRNFRLRDGGVIREKLLMLDDHAHACTYAILEAPMPVTNYVATLRLSPVARDGACFAEWTAEFDCAAADEPALLRQIGDGVFATALTHLRQRFGGRA
ncbi:MAG: SRPBCC family protein [Pseudomonadota bacterium]